MQWVPVPATAALPPVTITASAVPKRRKKRRTVRRLSVVSVTFALLTALTVLSDSDINSRTLLVPTFGVITAISTAWLLVLVTVRFFVHQRSKLWTGVLLVVLALDAALVGSLNAYADSSTVATTSVIQDYYAQVADAVSLGNAVSAGHAPAGITFTTVQAQAQAAESALAALDVPAELADYRSSVLLWADLVAGDAGLEPSINGWINVPLTPDPFDLTMTTDQADAAVAKSLQQIETLNIFGDRADAVKNLEGRRYIGARLDAQSYWLEAIYTSADPNWIEAHLQFVEPITYYQPPSVLGAMMPVASQTRSWPPPRHWPNCNPSGFAGCNIPRIQGPLGEIWRGSLAMQNTYTAPTSGVSALEKQFETIPGIDTSGGQNLGGAGAGYENTNPPPPAFADKCKAEGGTFGGSIYNRTQSRVPTSESGWTCQTPGSKCFDLLTYSGSEYQGGQSGCPEQGLIPTRPINIFRNGGGGTSAPGSSPSAPSSPSWDGTYTTTPFTVTCHLTAPGSGSGPPVDITQSRAGPVATFTVSNNTITPGGVNISPAGQATFSVPVPGEGAVIENLTFAHDANGGAHFSGTASYSPPLPDGATMTCSGSVSGMRN